MTLQIQSYLRDGGTYEALLEQYGIKAKRHGTHSNLVLLKYDQIRSPFTEQIVRECRGIILDEAADWCVVSRAFDKFFNHGEGHAAPIDWSTARVQEKLDGSLCVLYWYAGWNVATTGTPDASGDVNWSGLTFSDLFWRAFDPFRASLSGLPKNVCFYFELTSPHNRVVVPHSETRLTLLGARVPNRTSRGEMPIVDAARLIGVPPVASFPLQSFEQIAETFTSMSPLAQEGYVVVDAAFNRVKVKHPGYVALHHAKDGMSTKAFVDIARNGEVPEVIAAFPEFRSMLDEARARLDALVAECEMNYARLRDIPEQKAFALEAVKTRHSAPLFAVRSGKASSVREFYRTMLIGNLVELLGYKDAESPANPSTER